MSDWLRRYTNVLSLLDLLQHRRLTLLDPSTWFDKNDALGLRRYAELRGEGSVYAACFAQGYEQAHHWQIFAGHSHGLAIVFDKEALLGNVDKHAPQESILHKPVIYENLTEVRSRDPIALHDLPFLKRDTFKAEDEYRIVAWEDDLFWTEGLYRIPIDLACVSRIVLGPEMPDSLADSLREICSNIDGCGDIRFTKSKLVNNASWAEAISIGLRSYR